MCEFPPDSLPDQKNFVKVVRQTEQSLGIQCSTAGNSDPSADPSWSSAIELGLLAAAKSAEPVVASALTHAANILPDVFSQLGLSHIELRRAVGVGAEADPDLSEIAKGHGAGRGQLGAFGPVNSSSHKRSERIEVPRGPSLERNNTRRLYQAQGLPKISKRQAPQGCLMTS
jgi:hypothetical protein